MNPHTTANANGHRSDVPGGDCKHCPKKKKKIRQPYFSAPPCLPSYALAVTGTAAAKRPRIRSSCPALRKLSVQPALPCWRVRWLHLSALEAVVNRKPYDAWYSLAETSKLQGRPEQMLFNVIHEWPSSNPSMANLILGMRAWWESCPGHRSRCMVCFPEPARSFLGQTAPVAGISKVA